ncbi:MAG: transcriptional regulator [Chitinophagaceae bacterium]|nr:transcriptional regulator [Chitinophagaceae bacterium]
MELRPVKTKKQYNEYLQWVDEQFDKKVQPNSPEGEKLQVVLILIKDYEDKHFPVPMPDPVEVIKLKMLEKGMRSKDLVGKIGSKGHISAILSKRKSLTLQTARILHKELGIPAEVLLG